MPRLKELAVKRQRGKKPSSIGARGQGAGRLIDEMIGLAGEWLFSQYTGYPIDERELPAGAKDDGGCDFIVDEGECVSVKTLGHPYPDLLEFPEALDRGSADYWCLFAYCGPKIQSKYRYMDNDPVDYKFKEHWVRFVGWCSRHDMLQIKPTVTRRGPRVIFPNSDLCPNFPNFMISEAYSG